MDDGISLKALMAMAEEATGIPPSGQKLIINGRTLTSLDHDKTLHECRISNGCKLMVRVNRFIM